MAKFIVNTVHIASVLAALPAITARTGWAARSYNVRPAVRESMDGEGGGAAVLLLNPLQ